MDFCKINELQPKTQQVDKQMDPKGIKDTAGSATTIKYIEYSLYSGRTTQILGIIIKSSSEMAKIARPVQEIPKILEQSLYYCVLIENINHFLFVDIFSKNKMQ